MADILKLAEKKAEPDQDLVARFETMLAMAKSGELRSFCGFGLFANGDILTSTGPSDDRAREVGALTLLKARLVHEYMSDE